MATEAENGGPWPRAKVCQLPPNAGTGKGQTLALGEHSPVPTVLVVLILYLCFQIVREGISAV